VTVKNVVIYHPANGQGLYGWKPNNIHIENVEIIAYGNAWGAQPCPTDTLGGYRCMNIEIYQADNVRIKNVRTENGSSGIKLIDCPAAHLSEVVALNVRGPFPAGQCFQLATSHGSLLENFYCYNNIEIAYPEDSISIWQSGDVTVQHGTV